MNLADTPPIMTCTQDALHATFEALHAQSRCTPWVDRPTRAQWLDALARVLLDDQEAWVQALSADFGHRSPHETRLAEIFPAAGELRHAQRHLGRWMRERRVAPSLWFRPARARIVPQPLGVVGIVVPWNYPLQLAIAPLVAALAAGNRAMVKMSEFTPHTAALLAQRVARHFPCGSVVVVQGDAALGAAFTALPFDHLFFTGSTPVGHAVMRAAAEHLTPVTLELGGKSPVLIGPEAALDHAAERVLVGKMLNAGQTCIAPDYALVTAGREQAFIEALRRACARLYPALATTPDCTSIVNERHWQRLNGLLDDARAQGAQLLPLSDAAPDAARRRLPPVALLGVNAGMRVMREEIFGPLLPVVPVPDLAAALAHVNAHPRPLALYLFERDRTRQQQVLRGSVAGGVTLNDTLLHIAQENLPFGGVGASGMGRYHGEEGFRTFSQCKPVFEQSRLSGVRLFNPPYGARVERLLRWMIR